MKQEKAYPATIQFCHQNYVPQSYQHLIYSFFMLKLQCVLVIRIKNWVRIR